jgi:dihydroorotase
MRSFEIIQPDDWHVHFRDGEILDPVVKETSRHFGRAIVMPNLNPPIINFEQASQYKQKILKSIPSISNFHPLMTIYLTDVTDKKEILKYENNKSFLAAKLYPAGATTNSSYGIINIDKIMPILEVMSKVKMPLLIHGEVTDKKVDIFDREKVFIDKYLSKITKNFPELTITFEHITTNEAVQFVNNGNNNIGATITPHHIAMNRNAMLAGGIKPHLYCLPILKKEKHRLAILKAATSGNKKFFLGTDSAPHDIKNKECECGCAGIFNATYSIQILAEIFEKQNALSNLEKFISINGSRHYSLPVNTKKIKLTKSNKTIQFKEFIDYGKERIKVFKPDFPVYWKIEGN